MDRFSKNGSCDRWADNSIDIKLCTETQKTICTTVFTIMTLRHFWTFLTQQSILNTKWLASASGSALPQRQMCTTKWKSSKLRALACFARMFCSSFIHWRQKIKIHRVSKNEKSEKPELMTHRIRPDDTLHQAVNRNFHSKQKNLNWWLIASDLMTHCTKRSIGKLNQISFHQYNDFALNHRRLE